MLASITISSAYRVVQISGRSAGKLLMNKEKRRGPKTDPWGTQQWRVPEMRLPLEERREKVLLDK